MAQQWKVPEKTNALVKKPLTEVPGLGTDGLLTAFWPRSMSAGVFCRSGERVHAEVRVVSTGRYESAPEPLVVVTRMDGMRQAFALVVREVGWLELDEGVDLSATAPAPLDEGEHPAAGTGAVNYWTEVKRGARKSAREQEVQNERIASVCHEANRAYCASLGDLSQVPWREAQEWQRISARKGVQFILDNPGAPPGAIHDEWVRCKLADGWKRGPVKDAARKEHPSIWPYAGLTHEEQRKDDLFRAIVLALA